MTKYQVTLTTPARIYGKRRENGEVVEVDELIYSQLSKYGAIAEHVITSESRSHQPNSAGNASEGDTNGDSKLTVDEIKALLDARGIDYKGVRKRDDLLALLEQSEVGE